LTRGSVRCSVAVDVPLDRFGIEYRAVVVLHVLAQRESDLLSVRGSVPLLSQPGDDLASWIDAYERVVDLIVSVAVDECTRQHRVEVDHIVLEHEGQCAAGPGWFGGRLRGGGLCRRRAGGGCWLSRRVGRVRGRLVSAASTAGDNEAHRSGAQQARQKLTAGRHR